MTQAIQAEANIFKIGAMQVAARAVADGDEICTANLQNDFGKFVERKIMGGFGSGRWQHGKSTTNEVRSLDIRQLHRNGLLAPGRCFLWKWLCNGKEIGSIAIRTETARIVFNYLHRSDECEWQPMECSVALDWTSCNLGGRRPWFRCPVSGCGRRVAILFSGAMFICRCCRQLAYASQRETDDDRAARRADSIRQRLGWDIGIFNPEGGKPKGMHWRTFWRLKARHDAYVKISLTSMAQRFQLGQPRPVKRKNC